MSLDPIRSLTAKIVLMSVAMTPSERHPQTTACHLLFTYPTAKQELAGSQVWNETVSQRSFLVSPGCVPRGEGVSLTLC